MNENLRSLRGVKVLQFADDTKLMLEIREDKDRDVLQKAIGAVATWADNNSLPLHTSKTLHLPIGGSNFRYYVGEAKILSVQQILLTLRWT